MIREDGEAATYTYDAVGNLLAITRSSGVSLGASISSSAPPLGRGNTSTLTLAGSNLFGASASGSTGVTVTAVQGQLDSVAVTVTVAGDAPLGSGSVTIQTPYGAVVVPVTVQTGVVVRSMFPTKVVPGMEEQAGTEESGSPGLSALSLALPNRSKILEVGGHRLR